VPLTTVGDGLERRGSLADAVVVLGLNVEMNPKSTFAKRQHGAAAVLLAFRDAGVDSGVARLHALRTAYGTDAFPEFMLNGLGYALLRGGDTAEAVAVFTLAVEAFPQSANLYDSLGEAYAAGADTARAIANYERSLALNPANGNAARMLARLRGEH
jgi:tetratricopeptide (TPR) repeat protein